MRIIDLPKTPSSPYDFYIRLNGTKANSALICFRDYEKLLSGENQVNLIFALHEYIGHLRDVDIAVDNADFESGQMIGQLTQEGEWILISNDRKMQIQALKRSKSAMESTSLGEISR